MTRRALRSLCARMRSAVGPRSSRWSHPAAPTPQELDKARRDAIVPLLDGLADHVSSGTAAATFRVRYQPDGSEIWMIVAAVQPPRGSHG